MENVARPQQHEQCISPKPATTGCADVEIGDRDRPVGRHRLGRGDHQPRAEQELEQAALVPSKAVQDAPGHLVAPLQPSPVVADHRADRPAMNGMFPVKCRGSQSRGGCRALRSGRARAPVPLNCLSHPALPLLRARLPVRSGNATHRAGTRKRRHGGAGRRSIREAGMLGLVARARVAAFGDPRALAGRPRR